VFKTYLYIVFCQKPEIGKNYHILVIISLVHVATYAWFWVTYREIFIDHWLYWKVL